MKPVTRSFTASAVLDTHVVNGTAIDPPFLGPVTDLETAYGTPKTFTLTSTDISAKGVSYVIADAATGNAPTNVTVSIDQSTGIATLTPKAGFNGAINLLAAVTSVSGASGYDVQAFTLTVDAPTLGAVSDQADSLGTPATFTLTTPSAGTVAYKIVDQSTFALPANVTVSINQATGQITLTPAAGFVGTVNLRAGVRGSGYDGCRGELLVQNSQADGCCWADAQQYCQYVDGDRGRDGVYAGGK